jgi:uncharacterized protein (TIGR02147 family)
MPKMKNTTLTVQAANTVPNQKPDTPTRPDIYGYHDYRAFLVDWFHFSKSVNADFSVRKLAKASDVSESYISMVLSGERPLSELQLSKLLPHLDLDASERSYLDWLRIVIESSRGDERLEALKKIQRFRQYRELNPLEIEAYHYLTNWHYVVIREMTALPGFKADAKWIRDRFKTKVPLAQIRKGLDFLFANGFIELNDDGSVKKPDKRLQMRTGVLRPAIMQFHRDMLMLACDSIENTPSEERNISAHTCSIPLTKVEEVKRILDEARNKIAALSDSDAAEPDAVYHFSFLAFPMTKRAGG